MNKKIKKTLYLLKSCNFATSKRNLGIIPTRFHKFFVCSKTPEGVTLNIQSCQKLKPTQGLKKLLKLPVAVKSLSESPPVATC